MTEHIPQGNPRKRRLRVLMAGSASAALLLGLFSFADRAALAEKLERLQPEWALAGLVLYLLNLSARGWRLSLLSGLSRGDSRITRWTRVAAQHQLLFSALPSGVGDVGFPAIARRIIGVPLSTGVRLIGVYRLQDLWTLVMFVSVGLLNCSSVANIGFGWIVTSLCVSVLALVWSDKVTGVVFHTVLFLVRQLEGRLRGRWVAKVTTQLVAFLHETAHAPEANPMGRFLRITTALLTLVSWMFAGSALWALFAMIDVSLSASDIILIIGGLNLFGALATFSICGLGVGETALAAILIALGYSHQESVTISLIVRPAAMLNVFAAGTLVELVSLSTRLVWGATKPTS